MAEGDPAFDELAALRDAALQTSRCIQALQRRTDAQQVRHRLAQEDALALLEATLESSPDGILVVGLDERVLMHNQLFRSLWGWSAGSMAGWPIAVVRGDIRRELREPERFIHCSFVPVDPAAPGPPERFELDDGRCIERVVSTLRLRGSVAGTVEHWRDITDRERTHVERLARAAQSKFMSRMSHELRTPLNAILGFAQLLEVDPPSTPAQLTRQRVGHIIGAGRHLLALVDDLLHISRIEAGALELKVEPVSVATLVAESIALTHSLAAVQGVQLGTEPGAGAGLAIVGDPMRLRQVLVNLISNACKYNHVGGHAEVRVEAGDARVVLAVSDTGIGLTPEQVDSLFEPFKRAASEAGNTAAAGTGLGLVITRQLVLAMHGEITVSSLPGVGTTVRVSLPRAPSPPSPL